MAEFWNADYYIFITRYIRNVSDQQVFNECIQCIKAAYTSLKCPNIVIISDNEVSNEVANEVSNEVANEVANEVSNEVANISFKTNNFENKNLHKSVTEIENDVQRICSGLKYKLLFSEYPGAGEILRLYYFHKYVTNPEAIVISIHDSVFLHGYNYENIFNHGYEYFWTAIHEFDIPKNELPLIHKICPNLEHEYTNQRLWKLCFGQILTCTWNALHDVQTLTNLLDLVKIISCYDDRVSTERIVGFTFDYTSRFSKHMKYNEYTSFGNLHIYHSMLFQCANLNSRYTNFNYTDYLNHKNAYNNIPVIKVWCGR